MTVNAGHPLADLRYDSEGRQQNVQLDVEIFNIGRYAGCRHCASEATMSKPAISLFFMPREAMLVIEYPSGVVYRNQVQGVTCRQAEIEGVLAPVDFSDVDVERLMNLPYAPIDGIRTDIADALDEILAAAPRARYLKVDRARLHESSEAWVFVIADIPVDMTEYEPGSDYFGSVFGFGPTKAVLTWPNSD